jgi:hypothetical protein
VAAAQLSEFNGSDATTTFISVETVTPTISTEMLRSRATSISSSIGKLGGELSTTVFDENSQHHDPNTLTDYRLASNWRVGTTGPISWRLDKVGYGGEVMATQRLPNTIPVTWRRGNRSELIPTAGWVRKCMDTVWVVQDGYTMLVSSRDASLVPNWESEISAASASDMNLVTGVSCEGRGIRVDGYAIPVTGNSPPLDKSLFFGRKFSTLFKPDEWTSRPKLDSVEISLSAICGARTPELARSCGLLFQR